KRGGKTKHEGSGYGIGGNEVNSTLGSMILNLEENQFLLHESSSGIYELSVAANMEIMGVIA
ncbi:hypothetical protein A2U01_0077443, partial [Trifolium medium]|nr:hypothetical protein [Trifolium medium]